MTIQNSSRRDLLKIAGAIPFAGAFAGFPSALLSATTDNQRQIAGYQPPHLPSVERWENGCGNSTSLAPSA